MNTTVKNVFLGSLQMYLCNQTEQIKVNQKRHLFEKWFTMQTNISNNVVFQGIL